MNTIADLAWAAGIIDGEGSIFIMKQGREDRERTHNFVLRVVQSPLLYRANALRKRRCKLAMNTVNIWDGALQNAIDATGVGGITYIGESVPGAVTSTASWRIQKVEVVGTLTTIKYAAGGGKFDQIWDNRASLTYV